MRKIIYAISLFFLVGCDGVDTNDATSPAIQGNWIWQLSEKIIDSVVCGIECYHSSGSKDELQLGDTSFGRVKTTHSGSSEFVYYHSPNCDTVVMNKSGGHIVLEPDSGRLQINSGSLLLEGLNRIDTFTFHLSESGDALTLVSRLGDSAEYLRQ